jgi:A/G-specific adenine glycosylase
MVSKKQFQKIVLDFYSAHGRHKLPWRKTTDPHRILVSEIMLQQTQVDRVILKYNTFIKKFPTTASLANASSAEVLTLWSGLGYNRRALNLKKAAEIIVSVHKSKFPKNHQDLLALPGVGSYTASAVIAFSYNQKSICIETNIRTVFIYHFLKDKNAVSDHDIKMMIEKTLPEKRFQNMVLGTYGLWCIS